jgi:hypothetical protein
MSSDRLQKWEYCDLLVRPDNATTAVMFYRPHYKVILVEPGRVSAFRAMAKLGAEGWELVSVTQQWVTQEIFNDEETDTTATVSGAVEYLSPAGKAGDEVWM